MRRQRTRTNLQTDPYRDVMDDDDAFLFSHGLAMVSYPHTLYTKVRFLALAIPISFDSRTIWPKAALTVIWPKPPCSPVPPPLFPGCLAAPPSTRGRHLARLLPLGLVVPAVPVMPLWHVCFLLLNAFVGTHAAVVPDDLGDRRVGPSQVSDHLALDVRGVQQLAKVFWLQHWTHLCNNLC